MNSWKVILATIVIFGAGVITGGLLVNHVQRPVHAHPPSAPRQPEVSDLPPPQVRPDFLKKQFMQQLNDELQLSEGQSNQIQKIISQGQQSTRDLWKLVVPQFQLVWRDTRQQIRNVLTPEQRKKFETLMKQQRHPASTNAPPAQLTAPTNTPPPLEPSAPTNGPAV